ncbi:O-methyltransferase [Pseudogracilibacillus sp. SE30717A]|uniref:O-methyltransferase n=1 Tax=Pseudogracilibacillus sp. SE30717A TaxID=3098293 RepID=UPI00300E227F
MDSVNQYLLTSIPQQEKWILTLEEFAQTHRVPIMEPISMNFLTQLVRIKKPKSILEIGTAIGYSALRMHQAYPLTKITTIEKNHEMYEYASKHIFEQQKSEHIQLILGDALEAINDLGSQGKMFDFIFIDAAKGQYKNFFELVQPLLRDEGIIVCDNVLFKGYVANENKADNIRLKKMANKIRSFNEWLLNQKDYHTSIIPIGDGISISTKII